MAMAIQPILFISLPRSASNLFIRILGLDDQPNVHKQSPLAAYFFMNAHFYMLESGILTKPLIECPIADRCKAQELIQKSFDNLDSCLKEAQSQWKIFFNKEHSHMVMDPYFHSKEMYGEASVQGEAPWKVQIPGNPGKDSEECLEQQNGTMLPDAYLKKWRATFLIRNPALSIPSYYRAISDTRKSFGSRDILTMTKYAVNLGRIRRLFNWFESEGDGASRPLLLDADDVIRHPDVVRRYCEMVGLDPTKLQFAWTPEGSVENGDAKARFLKTLKESSGVIMEKAPEVVGIEHESRQWDEEFGPEIGRELRKLVEEVMGDYEYLRERRLRY